MSMQKSTKTKKASSSEASSENNNDVDLLKIVEMRIRGDASDFMESVEEQRKSRQARRHVVPPRPPPRDLSQPNNNNHSQQQQADTILPPCRVSKEDTFDILSLVAERAAQPPSLPDDDDVDHIDDDDQEQNTSTLELTETIKDTRAVLRNSNNSSTTVTPPTLSRARRASQVEPGAYPVAGIRAMMHHPSRIPSTGRTHGMDELGLELVSSSQDETHYDDDLVHADPVDDSENGEIATAEPITTRAKRVWKKKLCLHLSLQAIVAIAIVAIILLAFLLAPKMGNHKELGKHQNGVLPIDQRQPPPPPSTQEPSSLLEKLNLPDYTLTEMENSRSAQSRAYHWLSNNINKNNNGQNLPVWRLRQRFALATFYYATRGDNWVKNQGWLDWETNECNWEQIQSRRVLDQAPACDDNGQLLSLQFKFANNADGTIPPEISLLHESLERVVVSWSFQLKGHIPTEVGLLTRLKEFVLGTTHLSGTLPTELGQLRSLEQLLISSNAFVGTLPTELGNLSNLTNFIFDGANFSGSSPTEILQLSNLKHLGFTNCPGLDIEAFLPEVTRNMHNLETLVLGGWKPGRLTSIPSEVGKLTNLATLNLKGFQHNGPIPSEMGLLTQLTNLNLQRSSISGTLPKELSKMSQLEFLNLQSNKLEGKVLEQGVLHLLNKLQLLQIRDNLFSGSLPTEVGLWSSLEILSLQNTKISGTLPTELLLLDNFASLVVVNTSLTGSIPRGLCNKVVLKRKESVLGAVAMEWQLLTCLCAMEQICAAVVVLLAPTNGAESFH
ncbi:Leucine Rich Repeat [Seminavis robusta]|uniref:Leucine Rich Repeat n=1 Tax=Seminavis robusta TaxID=568900 RepID=A0A9N8E3Y0_9STRA|nr:Leucine Rich Repeat [Seminavis robusta]|eukprot:Sro593_g172300.1 Leucine Rich Repeat (783) ;mRNA; f:26526-29191